MTTMFHVYVGPYFKTEKVRSMKHVPRPAQCSRIPEHRVVSSGNFCPVCGAEVRPRGEDYAETQEYLNPCTLDKSVSDAFFAPIESCNAPGAWLPNVSGYGVTFTDGDILQELELVAEGIPRSLKKFELDFAPVLERIREKHDLAAVARFGVVSYYL